MSNRRNPWISIDGSPQIDQVYTFRANDRETKTSREEFPKVLKNGIY
jgi:hypothetical protein